MCVFNCVVQLRHRAPSRLINFPAEAGHFYLVLRDLHGVLEQCIYFLFILQNTIYNYDTESSKCQKFVNPSTFPLKQVCNDDRKYSKQMPTVFKFLSY